MSDSVFEGTFVARTPDQIGTALNQYEADNPIVGDPGDQPHNIWEDLIYQLPGYDEAATEEVDPQGYSDKFIANCDGKPVQFRYDDQGGAWKW